MVTAAAATAAVSARRMRRPSVTGCAPISFSAAISSAVMPPSGPTTRPMLRASGAAAKACFSVFSRASSQGTRIRSCSAMRERVCFHVSGAAISGARARRHCLAASWAILLSRSRRFSPSFASVRTTLRSILTGTTAAAPSSVSFWTMNSSLSALGRP